MPEEQNATLPQDTTTLALKALTRPLLAVMGYITLIGLAVGQAIGQAQGLPDWYLEASMKQLRFKSIP